jgi:hemin uptake protein HemP
LREEPSGSSTAHSGRKKGAAAVMDVAEAATTEKSLTSKELFQNGKTIVIKHAGEEYRMNITSKDKLILIK